MSKEERKAKFLEMIHGKKKGKKSDTDSVKEAAFYDELDKIAEEAPKKNTSYLKGMLGATRAEAIGDKARHMIVKPELIKERFKGYGKGFINPASLGAGAVAGAGTGLAIGRHMSGKGKAFASAVGAGIGALAGGEITGSYGGAKADKNFLKNKGITYKGVFIPRGFNFTPEAKEKYRVQDSVKEAAFYDELDKIANSREEKVQHKINNQKDYLRGLEEDKIVARLDDKHPWHGRGKAASTLVGAVAGGAGLGIAPAILSDKIKNKYLRAGVLATSYGTGLLGTLAGCTTGSLGYSHLATKYDPKYRKHLNEANKQLEALEV